MDSLAVQLLAWPPPSRSPAPRRLPRSSWSVPTRGGVHEDACTRSSWCASGVRWRSAGFTPIGYYKDQEKSAKTFRTFEGSRWSRAGRLGRRWTDGRRPSTCWASGSQVVNTGGEKVFPEEVEEALKTKFPRRRDGAVVGDARQPRFGERVCAVVDFGDDEAASPGRAGRPT